MKLKVCGLKNVNNIKEISQLSVDFMGFIFVDSSPRCVQLNDELIRLIRSLKCEKVGVFVNESVNRIFEIGRKLGLTHVQLHGEETPDKVELLADHFKVIKAFAVDETFDFQLGHYTHVDTFLFDAKGKHRGGNGIHFNWDLLNRYEGNQSFMLSGGLRLEDLDAIQEINHPKLIGIDVNSGFEIEAGLKDVEQLKKLKEKLDEVYC